MKFNPQPSTSESDPEKKIAILIQRKTQKNSNELSISYDTKLIEHIVQNEEEKANILKLVHDILLSCNISYLIYITNKIFNYLKSLFLCNLGYFIFINYLLNFLYKEKKEEKEKPASLWKRLLLFNVPEILIIFLYHRVNFHKKAKSIFFLFSYLNEKISYAFNNDTKNNYLCQIDQRNYDIFLIKKEEDHSKDDKNLYLTNIELLSKETFFDSIIAYPNANFGDFDFNNLSQTEEEMYQDIFELINDIEKIIKDEYKLLRTVSSFLGNFSYSISTKFRIFYALASKMAEFVIKEIILNKYLYKFKREKLIKEKSKEFNHKNMEKGYFLGLNEDVILLFKIKEKYKSFDGSYSILYEDSQNLFKHYFN